MLDKQQFLSSYSSFQRGHTFITLAFLAILAIQVVLFTTLSLWHFFEGSKTLLLIGIEIGVFMLVSKINEKRKGVFCSECSKVLMYKFGKEVVNTGNCPHCKKPIFK
jgi:hypothetical protein